MGSLSSSLLGGAALPPRRFAVVGSRSLSVSASPLVARVCSALVRSGGGLVVGCASGADEFVLSAALSLGFVSSVSCFSAFAADGSGSAGSVSAVSVVSAFAAAGGSVVWLAGGGLSVPVRARLAVRASVLVSAASAGCVGFLASPASVGSVRALSLAAARGLRVVCFPVGFSGALLPPLAAGGRWLPCASAGVWSAAWQWEQKTLF